MSCGEDPAPALVTTTSPVFSIVTGRGGAQSGALRSLKPTRRCSENMTAEPMSESKLNTLVQKLHDFLAHSSEESEETSSPPRLVMNQSTDKISGSGNNSEMMENSREEELALQKNPNHQDHHDQRGNLQL